MSEDQAKASSAGETLVVERLDRLLERLRTAEAQLKILSREESASLEQDMGWATQELQAVREEGRSAGVERLLEEHLRSRIAQLAILSRRVLRLLDSARSFYRALSTIHETEENGYAGLVGTPGARNRLVVAHRLEVRG